MSVADVEWADKIFSLSVSILKGKTVHKTPDPVAMDYITVLKTILVANKNITLFGDIFCEQGSFLYDYEWPSEVYDCVEPQELQGTGNCISFVQGM
jgi:hypothetical protein